MKKFVTVLSILLFFALITMPSMMFFIFGEKKEGLLDEKRVLSEMPQGFNNHYFSQLESWYNDHAPYRLSMITLEKRVKQKYEVMYRKEIHPFLSLLLAPSWYHGEDTFLAPIEGDRVIYGRDDWLFYLGDDSIGDDNIGYFKGSNLLSDTQLAEWFESFHNLDEQCRRRGVHLILASGPNKEIVYSEKMPSYYIENIPRREEILAAYMQNRGLHYVYPLNALLATKCQYPTYYQQDTHWNMIGGYVAVMEIYRELGIQTTDLEPSMITTVEKTGGDLSNFCGYATTYPDYVVTYKPEISYKTESYDDGNLEIISSTCGNGRTLLVIGDSFRHACKGYFAKDFETVVALHHRSINQELVSKAIMKLDRDDVLLIMPVERFDDSSVQVSEKVLNLLGTSQ